MSNLITILFLFVRIISNPIANALQKKISINLSSTVINFYTYLILSIMCIPLYKNVDITALTPSFLFYTLTAGFLCSIGTLCLIKAVSLGELSILGPINSYKSVVGLIAAFVFLKEIPDVFGILGMIMIIWGSYYIFESTQEGFSPKIFLRKDIQYRFLALILTGIEAAILKQIIIMSSVEVCLIFWGLTGLLWSFIMVLIFKKSIKITNTKITYNLIIIAFCLGLMQYSTNYIFSKINVGYALALFQLSSLITVFLGYKMFKEKNITKKLVGTTIMIIGSCLIILNPS